MPDLSALADEQLTSLISGGDQSAFRELFFRHYDALYRFLYRRIRDEETIKDMLQDVFAKLWQNRSNLEPGQSIKAYLFRSTNNILIDHFRKKSSSEMSLDDSTWLEPVTQPDDSFALEDTIRDAIQQLPSEIRRVFMMNRYDDLKYADIAEMLGISVKTVESRMTKALKSLRIALKPYLIILVTLTLIRLISSYWRG
jgi:RNA polymerase sigma-70 factor (ECF subfamily)